MKLTADGIIRNIEPNITGTVCAECDQIAFRIVIAGPYEETLKIPLCGKHYVDACLAHPILSSMEERTAGDHDAA